MSENAPVRAPVYLRQCILYFRIIEEDISKLFLLLRPLLFSHFSWKWLPQAQNGSGWRGGESVRVVCVTSMGVGIGRAIECSLKKGRLICSSWGGKGSKRYFSKILMRILNCLNNLWNLILVKGTDAQTSKKCLSFLYFLYPSYK